MSSFCERDTSLEKAIYTSPPSLECVWAPCALKGPLGSRDLSLGGHSEGKTSRSHHQDQTPIGPDKTSLEGPDIIPQQETPPMQFCTDNRWREGNGTICSVL